MYPTLYTALEQISAHEGCEPADLPPLYEVIDPDAARSLLEADSDVVVRFDYLGYRVVIAGEMFTVTPLEG